MDKISQVKEITTDLLKRLGIVGDTQTSQNKEGTILVQIESGEPGVVIGYHGETLAALQLLTRMIAYRKFGEWSQILLNVGDYRERRKDSLEKMALGIAQRVKFSKQPQSLPAMSSFERRIIHLALANDPEIETVSEGEGRIRHVVIKPK